MIDGERKALQEAYGLLVDLQISDCAEIGNDYAQLEASGILTGMYIDLFHQMDAVEDTLKKIWRKAELCTCELIRVRHNSIVGCGRTDIIEKTHGEF